MKKTVAASAFALLVGLALAHGGEACGQPAPWEFHKTAADLVPIAAAIILGVAGARIGMKGSNKPVVAAGIVLVLLGAGAFLSGYPYNQELVGFGNAGSTHEHADFAVYIQGRQINFSADKYMTTDNGVPKSGLAHLHDGFGTVLHKHATGVTFSYFLRTIGWRLSDECVMDDMNNEYCSGANGTLALYVNGNQTAPIAAYSPADGDRILLAYGSYSENETGKMMAAVTNYSCIHSEKCPAPPGVVLPEESC